MMHQPSMFLFRSKLLTFLLLSFCFLSCVSQPAAVKQIATTELSDSALLDLVQQQTIRYFTEGAEPVSGMGRERFHTDNDYPENDKHIVTSGGSGFGVMALIVAMERKFITREEGGAAA